MQEFLVSALNTEAKTGYMRLNIIFINYLGDFGIRVAKYKDVEIKENTPLIQNSMFHSSLLILMGYFPSKVIVTTG